MVNAQELLNKKYPNKEERKNMKSLSVMGSEWEGKLDLSDFTNLESFMMFITKITSLNLSKNIKLNHLVLNNNYGGLDFLDISNCPELQKDWATSYRVEHRGTHIGRIIIGKDGDKERLADDFWEKDQDQWGEERIEFPFRQN